MLANLAILQDHWLKFGILNRCRPRNSQLLCAATKRFTDYLRKAEAVTAVAAGVCA